MLANVRPEPIILPSVLGLSTVRHGAETASAWMPWLTWS